MHLKQVFDELRTTIDTTKCEMDWLVDDNWLLVEVSEEKGTCLY